MLSLYIMMVAKDMFWLSAGNFLFSALNNFPTTVYAAVIPELIHPEQVSATACTTVLGGRRFHSDASLQRGQAAAFANLMMLGGTLAGNGLGYLTGVGVLSQEMAYGVLIVLNIVDIPLGMMGVGVSPGWWSPERPAEEPPAGASGGAGGGGGGVVAAAAR